MFPLASAFLLASAFPLSSPQTKAVSQYHLKPYHLFWTVLDGIRGGHRQLEKSHICKKPYGFSQLMKQDGSWCVGYSVHAVCTAHSPRPTHNSQLSMGGAFSGLGLLAPLLLLRPGRAAWLLLLLLLGERRAPPLGIDLSV